MTTKYRLPFEVSPPVKATFKEAEATNHWTIPSRTLRQLMDHFGPGIELLDIHTDDDQTVNFTCFTEKVAQGDGECLLLLCLTSCLHTCKEVLKKPLHTSIAVERDEFQRFEVTEDTLHIVISVKDFRAIMQHAAFLGSEVSAHYSRPSRPMQLQYETDGVKCEFLLMTVGERAAQGQKPNKTRGNAKAPRPQQLDAAASRATSHAPTPAPQPTPARQDHMPSLRPSMVRPSQRPPPPAFEDDSLFVPMDNDNQWEPVNLNEDEDEENARLEWDASARPVSPVDRPRITEWQANHSQNPSAMNMRLMASQAINPTARDEPNQAQGPSTFEPTQRLTEVRKYGLFGD
jgi:cell cycle checkpoint control protein RAD9A